MLVPAVGNTHDRGDAHDRPGAARAHRRQRRPHHADHALQVDIERVVPFRVGQLRQRHLVRDSGVADENIERAMSLFRFPHHRLGLCRGRDVEREEFRLAAGGKNFRGHGLAFARQDVGDDDAMAGTPERQRRRAADADAAAGDQDVRLHREPFTASRRRNSAPASARRTGSRRRTRGTRSSPRPPPVRRNGRAAIPPPSRASRRPTAISGSAC